MYSLTFRVRVTPPQYRWNGNLHQARRFYCPRG